MKRSAWGRMDWALTLVKGILTGSGQSAHHVPESAIANWRFRPSPKHLAVTLISSPLRIHLRCRSLVSVVRCRAEEEVAGTGFWNVCSGLHKPKPLNSQDVVAHYGLRHRHLDRGFDHKHIPARDYL